MPNETPRLYSTAAAVRGKKEEKERIFYTKVSLRGITKRRDAEKLVLFHRKKTKYLRFKGPGQEYGGGLHLSLVTIG